uniref:Uncharacterized protein n=1 Tax=Anguilla anguilla TaxID=7936 RepID=A0A0E9VLN8_ANGAN
MICPLPDFLYCIFARH